MMTWNIKVCKKLKKYSVSKNCYLLFHNCSSDLKKFFLITKGQLFMRLLFLPKCQSKFEGFLPYPQKNFQARNPWLAIWKKQWPLQFILNLIDLCKRPFKKTKKCYLLTINRLYWSFIIMIQNFLLLFFLVTYNAI
mgnify:CR=1 FL=1